MWNTVTVKHLKELWASKGALQMCEAAGRTSRKRHLLGVCMVITLASTPCLAADADQGKPIAKRWCATCHLVERDQANATDKAPTFVSVARMPDFNQNKLAFLLLLPHPNMPSLSLSRSEVADLADYIATLK
jgi:mono/diheme cytochrome c family protein